MVYFNKKDTVPAFKRIKENFVNIFCRFIVTEFVKTCDDLINRLQFISLFYYFNKKSLKECLHLSMQYTEEA